MKRILSCILVLVVSVTSALAQTRSATSIVIKFRTASSLASPSLPLQTVLSSISRVSISNAERILPDRNSNTLSTINIFGLDRIIILPLNKNISADSIALLVSKFSEVEYAEPNHITHIDLLAKPNDSLYNEQWAHTAMDVLGAWKTTQGDSTIHIGFVDTGVEWDHPDLIGQFAVNPLEDINHNGLFDAWSSSEKHLDARGNLVSGDLDGIDQDGNGYIDDVIGYDFVDQENINFGDAQTRDAIPFDEEPHSHGTAVASVIGAIANNKIGLAGIAPKCKLVALRAFDATGNAEDDDIATAIIYAANNHIRIVNLSFGDVVPSMLQRDAIRYATAQGVLVVASSGNAGGDGRHYPSDFDECMSVGMTTRDQDGKEVIAVESQHGEAMDLIAPGGGINVLSVGGYQVLSGTSFSAPAVAAVAGLILASHPKASNDNLRTILESTTDDQFPLGFDHTHANGRVNAKRAVEFVGAATLKIASPNTDDVFHIGTVANIRGTVASPLFNYWTLSYAQGLNPDADVTNPVNWIVIDSSDKQVIDNTLTQFKTKDLASGIYTLRLAMKTSDSRTIEERMNIVLTDTTQFNTTLEIDTLYDKEKRILLVSSRSASVTRATLLYRTLNSTNSWQAKNDDRSTKNHYITLTTNDVEAGVPLELKIVLRTSSGDSSSLSTTATLPNEAISHTGFVQKPYSLPSGYLLDSVITTSGNSNVIESIAPGGANYGAVTVFTFNKTKNKFFGTDSLNIQALPRSVGNITGDGKPEILLQGSGNDIYIYHGNAAHSILGDLSYVDTSTGLLFATSLTDVDADGKDELVALATIRSGNSLYQQFEVNKLLPTRTKLGSLINTTLPAPHYAANNYSIADSRSADFLGNGTKQIVILDDDADLSIFKYDPSSASSFTTIFTDQNDGNSESRNIAVGDFNGDGKPDIAIAFHKSYDVNDDNEYDFNYWTVKVLFNLGNDSFRTAYIDHFNTARSSTPYRSSLGSVHSVTGNKYDDLVLSLFPNFYLLEFDAAKNTMRPIWHFPIANSPRGAIAFDFDGNGKREFGFTAGDSINFFEQDQSLTDKAPAPAGLEVIPRDVDRVDLHWSPIQNATQYYILRAPNVPNAQYVVIDSTATTNYIDSDVANGETYIYSVASFVPTFTNPSSTPAPGIFCFVHPTPRVTINSWDQNRLRLHTSQLLSTSPLSGDQFVIDERIGASSAIIGGDSLIILTLDTTPVGSQTHTLRIRSFDVRDIWNSPFDTTAKLQWTPPIVHYPIQFYIVRWRFEGSRRIHVEFSLRPDDNALDPSHYTLSPFGKIVNITRDPLNDTALYLELSPNTVLNPIGRSYVLCIDNITGESSPLETPTGNCLGETPTAASLDHVFVYPSPVRASDETITFAGLTAQAEISIYSTEMRFLKRITTIDRSGGVQWDMRDENAKALPSGVYIYHVTGKDDAGNSVKTNESKFVIIRDR